MLQKILSRHVVPFHPHKHHPECVVTYCVEELECGHRRHAFPQCDPLVARYRNCPECHTKGTQSESDDPAQECAYWLKEITAELDRTKAILARGKSVLEDLKKLSSEAKRR